jgi:hypothetical protein
MENTDRNQRGKWQLGERVELLTVPEPSAAFLLCSAYYRGTRASGRSSQKAANSRVSLE